MITVSVARAVIGLATMAYTDPTLAIGGRIKAAHHRELRAGVK